MYLEKFSQGFVIIFFIGLNDIIAYVPNFKM